MNVEAVRAYVYGGLASRGNLVEQKSVSNVRKDTFTQSNFSREPMKAWEQMKATGMDLRGVWAFSNGKWTQTQAPAFTLEEVEKNFERVLDMANVKMPSDPSLSQEYKQLLAYSNSLEEAATRIKNAEFYQGRLETSAFYKELQESLWNDLQKYKSPNEMISSSNVMGSTYINLYCHSVSVGVIDRNVRTALERNNVPDDITFSVDYDNNRRTFVLTEISDEVYRTQVEDALDSALNVGSIHNISREAAFISGRVEEYYYSYMSDMLKEHFGQDINDLWLDENGNIKGANYSLQSQLWAEKGSNNNEQGMLKYGFLGLGIGNGLKQLLSMPECHESTTKMVFDSDGFYLSAGDLKLGRVDYPDIQNDERLLKLYHNLISNNQSYKLWLNDCNAFK